MNFKVVWNILMRTIFYQFYGFLVCVIPKMVWSYYITIVREGIIFMYNVLTSWHRRAIIIRITLQMSAIDSLLSSACTPVWGGVVC